MKRSFTYICIFSLKQAAKFPNSEQCNWHNFEWWTAFQTEKTFILTLWHNLEEGMKKQYDLPYYWLQYATKFAKISKFINLLNSSYPTTGFTSFNLLRNLILNYWEQCLLEEKKNGLAVWHQLKTSIHKLPVLLKRNIITCVIC